MAGKLMAWFAGKRRSRFDLDVTLSHIRAPASLPCATAHRRFVQIRFRFEDEKVDDSAAASASEAGGFYSRKTIFYIRKRHLLPAGNADAGQPDTAGLTKDIVEQMVVAGLISQVVPAAGAAHASLLLCPP